MIGKDRPNSVWRLVNAENAGEILRTDAVEVPWLRGQLAAESFLAISRSCP